MSKLPKRSEFDDTIWQELMGLWDAAFYQTASSAERQARWLALFFKANEAGLSKIDVDLVASLLRTGWTDAMVRADYAEAVRLTEPFFEHHRCEQADVVSRIEMSCSRATALLYTGQAREAIDLYQSLLERVKDRPGHARSAALVMCSHLREYCTDQPADHIAPSALARLVYDVVCRRSRRVRRSAPRYAPREGASYRELVLLLAMTQQGG